MKRFKITSVVLSVAMLFSMLMPSVGVMADEASTPSETQTTESEDKKEPEETKKPEPKESETVKETETPKETEAPEETEPAKETEKAEPEETEPSVSETEAPKETEKNEPDTTEKPEDPEETSPVESEVPGEPDASASVKPKMAVGKINATIISGILHWTAYQGAEYYWIYINGDYYGFSSGTSFDLTKEIDRRIKLGHLPNSSPYSIYMEAFDLNNSVIATWSGSLAYNSSATYIPVGNISNPKINNGILTWDSYSGTSYYEVTINDDEVGLDSGHLNSNTFNLDNFIKTLIEEKKISIKDSYYIGIQAYNNEDIYIAGWNDNYSYAYVKTDISGATVTEISDKTYTGAAITQTFTVKLNGKILTLDSDYTVSYSNNTNAGTATLTISGIGSYEGVIKKQFSINPADISSARTSNFSSKSYTGEALTQSVMVVLNGKLLSNTDYKVSYSDNINAGTAKATITGIGNYTGTIEKTFTILALNITNATVKGIEDVDYSGSAVTPSPTLTLNNKTLAEGTDYDVSYADNINAGYATVRITGKGNYEGIIVKSFTIKTVDISNAQISGIADMPYTGSEISLTPVLTLNGIKLAEGTDYTLIYENNTEIGTATVKITGTGSCTGSFSTTFNIVAAPNPMRFTSGKTVKVKYKKLRKKKQTVSLPKTISLSNAQGSVTYKLNSAKKSKKSYKKYFKINSSTGTITVKKKLKKGTYTISCSVTAAGNQNYNKVTKGVTIKIKVK